MAKTPKTATITVGGKEYKLQHPGTSWYLNNDRDSRDARGVRDHVKYIQSVLDFVVTEPRGLTVDDFSVGEVEALIPQIESFLRA